MHKMVQGTVNLDFMQRMAHGKVKLGIRHTLEDGTVTL